MANIIPLTLDDLPINVLPKDAARSMVAYTRVQQDLVLHSGKRKGTSETARNTKKNKSVSEQMEETENQTTTTRTRKARPTMENPDETHENVPEPVPNPPEPVDEKWEGFVEPPFPTTKYGELLKLVTPQSPLTFNLAFYSKEDQAEPCVPGDSLCFPGSLCIALPDPAISMKAADAYHDIQSMFISDKGCILKRVTPGNPISSMKFYMTSSARIFIVKAFGISPNDSGSHPVYKRTEAEFLENPGRFIVDMKLPNEQEITFNQLCKLYEDYLTAIEIHFQNVEQAKAEHLQTYERKKSELEAERLEAERRAEETRQRAIEIEKTQQAVIVNVMENVSRFYSQPEDFQRSFFEMFSQDSQLLNKLVPTLTKFFELHSDERSKFFNDEKFVESINKYSDLQDNCRKIMFNSAKIEGYDRYVKAKYENPGLDQTLKAFSDFTEGAPRFFTQLVQKSFAQGGTGPGTPSSFTPLNRSQFGPSSGSPTMANVSATVTPIHPTINPVANPPIVQTPPTMSKPISPAPSKTPRTPPSSTVIGTETAAETPTQTPTSSTKLTEGLFDADQQ